MKWSPVADIWETQVGCNWKDQETNAQNYIWWRRVGVRLYSIMGEGGNGREGEQCNTGNTDWITTYFLKLQKGI